MLGEPKQPPFDAIVSDVLAERLRERLRGLSPEEIEAAVRRLHRNLWLRCRYHQMQQRQASSVVVHRHTDAGSESLPFPEAVAKGWIRVSRSVSDNDVIFLPEDAGTDVVYEIDGEESELEYTLPEPLVEPIPSSSEGDVVKNSDSIWITALSQSPSAMQAAGLEAVWENDEPKGPRLKWVESSWYDQSRGEPGPDLRSSLELLQFDEGPNELQVAAEGGSDWMFVRLATELSETARDWPTTGWERGSVFSLTLSNPPVSSAAQLAGRYVIVFLAADVDGTPAPLLRTSYLISD